MLYPKPLEFKRFHSFADRLQISFVDKRMEAFWKPNTDTKGQAFGCIMTACGLYALTVSSFHSNLFAIHNVNTFGQSVECLSCLAHKNPIYSIYVAI